MINRYVMGKRAAAARTGLRLAEEMERPPITQGSEGSEAVNFTLTLFFL